MVRRVRSVEVGKAGEEQLGGEVVECEVLLVVTARDVAAVGRWFKGGVGAGNEGDILGGDDDEVPGERHDAVNHWRKPAEQGDGDLPGSKLTQLLKACIVIHNSSDNDGTDR